MREQLITPKTLQLAVKRGFNLVQHIITVYNGDKPNEQQLDEFGVTQSLLQKWLRDKHKLHIDIRFNNLTCLNYTNPFPYYFYYIYETTLEGITVRYEDTRFSTFEEALEDALQEGLKLIK